MLFALLKPLCSLSPSFTIILLALLSSIYYFIIRPQNSVRSLKALRKKRKRERQKERKIDRLSVLSDDILLHIMQFMIPKHYVQTCVLSKRWKNLWRNLTNINLHHFETNYGEIFEKFVSEFLSSRDDDDSIPLDSISYVNGCSIRHFRGYYRDLPPKDHKIPAKIIEYVASHNVQQVEIIDAATIISSKLLGSLPSIFNCSSLTSLTLCLYRRGSSTTLMFPKSLNLPALETLKLGGLTFFSSDNGYAEPFSTCNMLSKLAILGCNLQDDAQGLCISNSKLSNLAIGMIDPDSDIHKVILYTPKLTSLTVNGIHPNFPAPSTCNLTLLEELKFDCRHGYTMGEDILISWLHLLAEVNIITLNFKTLQLMVNVLKTNGSMSAQLPCFVIKSLKVEAHSWICHEIIKEMVTYLLQNSPPPDTFVISKEVDLTSDNHMFIGSSIEYK